MNVVDSVMRDLLRISALCSRTLYEDTFSSSLDEEETMKLIEIAENLDMSM